MPIVKIEENDAIFNDFAQVHHGSIDGLYYSNSTYEFDINNATHNTRMSSINKNKVIPPILQNHHSALLKTDVISLKRSQLSDLHKSVAFMQTEISLLQEKNSRLEQERDELQLECAKMKGDMGLERSKNDDYVMTIRTLRKENDAIKNQTENSEIFKKSPATRLQSVILTMDEDVLEQINKIDKDKHNGALSKSVISNRIRKVFRRKGHITTTEPPSSEIDIGSDSKVENYDKEKESFQMDGKSREYSCVPHVINNENNNINDDNLPETVQEEMISDNNILEKQEPQVIQQCFRWSKSLSHICASSPTEEGAAVKINDVPMWMRKLNKIRSPNDNCSQTA